MIENEIETLLNEVWKIYDMEISLKANYEALDIWNERIVKLSIFYNTFLKVISEDEYFTNLFVQGLKETVHQYKNALWRCRSYEKKDY
jgi:hypothetical protein